MPNPDEKDIVDETAAVSLEPTMWAELSPDMYDGPTCDRVRHRWWVRCQGEEGEYQHDDLVLDPKAFPPGTKITIQEPRCPNCGEIRMQVYPAPKEGPRFDTKCNCGFDWEAWTANEYS